MSCSASFALAAAVAALNRSYNRFSAVLRSRNSAMLLRRARPASVFDAASRCRVIASHSSSIPSPETALVPMTGAAQADGSRSCAPSVSICFKSVSVRLASLRSHFDTTWMSAISRRPALIAWTSSPRPGAETTTVVWEARTISTSSWPTPTVSRMMTPKPAASRISAASSAARAMPPVAPCVAMLRI